MKTIHPCLLVLVVFVFAATACKGGVEGNGNLISPTPTIPRTRVPRTTATSTLPILVIGDGGLLSGEPCGPPCFWGIEPGKTTQSEAFQILTKLDVMKACESYDYFENLTNEWIGGWACQSKFDYRFEKPRGFGVSFRKSTGIVDNVGFVPTIPITLQDVIAKHGFPDVVVVLDNGLPEYPTVQASIYYSDLRTIFPLSEEQEGTEFHIEPTTLIDGVVYLDSDSLQHDLEIFAENILPWHGYGAYKLP